MLDEGEYIPARVLSEKGMMGVLRAFLYSPIGDGMYACGIRMDALMSGAGHQ